MKKINKLMINVSKNNNYYQNNYIGNNNNNNNNNNNCGNDKKEHLISIVVPVYNEQATVRSTLEKIKEVMQTSSFDYELIAVNDGSKDHSKKIIEEIDNIILISHPVNKGYSSSLKTGIRKAQGDFILITDADGTYPIEDIPRLLQHIDQYDMVVGARTGKHVKIPFLRKPAKWFLSKVANYIAEREIPDLNSGLRVFKKDIALEFWRLLPQRFSFTITMTMACLTNNYDVKYIPINYYKRKTKSTIHPIKDFLGFNKILLRICLFFRPLKIFIPFSFFVFLMGLGIFAGGLFLNKFLDTTLVMISLSAIQIFILGLIAELIIRQRTFK